MIECKNCPGSGLKDLFGGYVFSVGNPLECYFNAALLYKHPAFAGPPVPS